MKRKIIQSPLIFMLPRVQAKSVYGALHGLQVCVCYFSNLVIIIVN